MSYLTRVLYWIPLLTLKLIFIMAWKDILLDLNMWSFCCSVTQSCPTLCHPIDCRAPNFPVLHYLPEFAQIHVHWVNDAIQPSHPPTFLLLSSIFPSIRVFSNESSHEMAKVLELQLQHQPFQWIFRLLSFRIDWFDLPAVQGTFKSVLQHHNSKSINSLMLSLLYGPTLTSVHDYWKNHSSDYMDLCWQSDVSGF